MSDLNKTQALENIYKSLENDNQDIDLHINAMKEVLAKENTNVITVEPTRLVQNNRAGRKLMQSYFRKRGIVIEFAE